MSRAYMQAYPTVEGGEAQAAPPPLPPPAAPPPNTGPGALTRAEQYARSACPACRGRQSKYDPRHTRIAGDCLHPDIQTELTCPGCMTGRPRWHDLHTLQPGECRWAVATVRRLQERQARGRHDEPRPALPRAHEEPTARVGGAHRLGTAEEEAARLEEQRAQDAFDPLLDPMHPELPGGASGSDGQPDRQ
eukprot:2449275-Amphidinium_carterae.1